MDHNRILFISHAQKDQELVDRFVNLLLLMGINEKNIFYSSLPAFSVPIREDIYDYLRNLLDKDIVIPIFMLSDNYYDSVACLNEMGAIWVKRNDSYFTFILPGFEFKEIKGAINPNKKGIKLDDSEVNVRGELTRFKDILSQSDMFSLNISNAQWESILAGFLNDVNAFCPMIMIDINYCKGLCIGEHIHDGCQVTVEKASNKVTAVIDFSLTKSELCSVVFSTGSINAKRSATTNKSLKFRVRALGDVKKIRVEPHLETSNPCYFITPESNWVEYSIRLTDFRTPINDWKNFRELCFVVDRRSASKFTLEISNIRIE